MLRFGCADMSDGDFLRSFQDRDIPASQFHHGDHLRLAWLLLERLPVEDATDAACRGLRAFAHRNGAAMHFHETLTRGWMRLLAARSERTFSEFAAEIAPSAHENPLHRYWSPEVLGSEAARVSFVEPDREPLPPVSSRWRTSRSNYRARRTVPLPVDSARMDEKP